MSKINTQLCLEGAPPVEVSVVRREIRPHRCLMSPALLQLAVEPRRPTRRNDVRPVHWPIRRTNRYFNMLDEHRSIVRINPMANRTGMLESSGAPLDHFIHHDQFPEMNGDSSLRKQIRCKFTPSPTLNSLHSNAPGEEAPLPMLAGHYPLLPEQPTARTSNY